MWLGVYAHAGQISVKSYELKAWFLDEERFKNCNLTNVWCRHVVSLMLEKFALMKHFGALMRYLLLGQVRVCILESTGHDTTCIEWLHH